MPRKLIKKVRRFSPKRKKRLGLRVSTGLDSLMQLPEGVLSAREQVIFAEDSGHSFRRCCRPLN